DKYTSNQIIAIDGQPKPCCAQKPAGGATAAATSPGIAQPPALQTWAATAISQKPGPGQNPEIIEIGTNRRKHIRQSPELQAQGHQVCE
ncbi:Hypothetical predicted protein, partial [Marmota monax]